MPLFYDTHLNTVFTEHGLAQRGLPIDHSILQQAGILPYECTIPPHDTLTETATPREIVVNDSRAIQEFEITDLPIDTARSNAKEWVASKRWEHETGGIELNSIQVQTSIEDQNRINSTIQGMELAGLDSVDFKSVGGWVRLSLAEIKQLAIAITHHVESCFSKERQVCAAIDSADTVEEIRTIIHSGWPEDD